MNCDVPMQDNFSVASPLSGLTKDEVREVSRELELPNWNFAASPCLRSRLALNVEVSNYQSVNCLTPVRASWPTSLGIARPPWQWCWHGVSSSSSALLCDHQWYYGLMVAVDSKATVCVSVHVVCLHWVIRTHIRPQQNTSRLLNLPRRLCGCNSA